MKKLVPEVFQLKSREITYFGIKLFLGPGTKGHPGAVEKHWSNFCFICFKCQQTLCSNLNFIVEYDYDYFHSTKYLHKIKKFELVLFFIFKVDLN